MSKLTGLNHSYLQATLQEEPYPVWVASVAICLAIVSFLPIPLVALLRCLKIVKVETDIPSSVRRMNTTPSTTAMMGMEETSDQYDGSGNNSAIETGNQESGMW